MTKRRAHISLTTKLAATLLQLRGNGGKRLIPHEHAKNMTAEQIVSLYEFHHNPIPKAEPFNGPDEPWNLEPRMIADHSHSTNKDNGTGRSDRKVIARTRKSIKKKNAREAKERGETDGKREFKRSWPKRELRSRNSFQNPR
jgi:hypothetical protein